MNCPSFKEVEAKLMESIKILFKKDEYLFRENVNERSISHMLAFYLKSQFSKWDVDCEYNKNHDDPKKIKNLKYVLEEDERKNLIRDTDGITVYPDIIVHHRGTSENLLVIEIKKSTSRVKSDNFDKKKLIGFSSDSKLMYRNAVFLKFKVGNDCFGLKEIAWKCKDGKLF